MKYSHRKQLRINKKKFRDVVWELTYRKYHRICRLRKIIIEEIKTLNKSECSICYELTNNKTNCNHDVCLICLKKINKCPLCRIDLFSITDDNVNEDYGDY